MSTLLVDGESYAPDQWKAGTGKLVASALESRGGSVTVDGTSNYGGLGVQSARRTLSVDLHATGARLAIWDRVRSSAEHTYTFQLNLGDEASAGGFVVTPVTEAGRPGFLVRSARGWLKGWVAHPPGATVEPSDPLRVTWRGRDLDLWIVMELGTGEPPVAHEDGQGAPLRLDGDLRVGGVTARLDQAALRTRWR
jgi:hypothetical protein